LNVGDSRGKIEIELQKLQIATSYDRFKNRYQAAVPTTAKGMERDVAIWIYLDEQKEKIERIEVEDVHTFL
jgi:hypothetical protein